jgi:ElaB/YqjD/DUF883 family membrane-anchored ribosome-binding protein
MSTKTKTESHRSDALKPLLHEAKAALNHSAGEAGEKLDTLRGRMRSALDRGRDSFDRLRAETARRAKQADKLVRNKPYHAAGIAAGIGALVGILVARRYRSSR